MAKVYRRDDPIEPASPPPGAEPDGARPDATNGGPAGEPVPRRHRGRKTAFNATRAVLVVAAVALGLILLLAALLQTEWGRQRVEGITVGQLRALLSETAELEVGRVEGNFLTGARLLDVEIREGSELAIAADTLGVRYSLLTLFRRTFSAERVYASGLRVWARQSADSTWNVARILEPAPEREDEPTPWTVRLAEVDVRRSALEIHFYNPDRDSVLTAVPLALSMSGFVYDNEGARGRLDTLSTVVTPAVEDPVPVRVAGSGALAPGRIEIGGLHLASTRSDVRLSGVVDWDGDELWFEGDGQGMPLAFADLRQFAPLPLHGTAEVRFQAQGTPTAVSVRLNADFEDNGVLNLTGAFTPGDGPVRYVAEGQLEAFDLGRFLANPALAGSLNAELAVDLEGPRLQEVSGDVDIRVRGSEFADRRIRRADLSGQFDAGRLRFSAGGDLPGARFFAQGTARPFADLITYDVSGEVNDLDLAALTQDPERQGRVARATFRASGRGTDPETLTSDFRVTTGAAQFGDLALDASQASGSLTEGTLRFNAEATLAAGGGQVAAVGSARPFADPLAYDIERGELRNVNLAAITGNPDQQSDLTGTFALSGRGTDPETLTLDLSARVTGSRYGEFAVETLDLTGSLRGGDLRFDASADLGAAGALTAVGSARPFADPLPYELTGTARNLDVGALTGDPEQSSDLTGTFAVTGTGTDPETMAAEFRLDLERSSFGAQPIAGGTLRGTLRAGRVDAAVDVSIPEGQFAFDATLRPFEPALALTLRNGRFSGVNLALLTDNPALQTNLAGTFTLDFSGRDPALAVASGQIALARSTVNAARIEGGLVSFRLDRGFTAANARLTFDEGTADLRLEGRLFDDVPTYALAGTLTDVDVVAIVGDRRGTSRTSLTIDARGRGTDPETMTAEIRLTAADTRLPDAQIDTLEADLTLANGVLQARSFRLDADFAEAEGSGQIALFNATAATDFHLRARFREAGPLNAFFEEELTIDSADLNAHVTGPAGGPIAVDADAIVRQAMLGRIGARRLDLRLNGTYDADADIPFEGRARARFDYVSLPTFSLRDGDVDLTYLDNQLTAGGSVRVDDTRDVAFNARINVADDDLLGAGQAIELADLNIRVDEEQWALVQPATIFVGDRRYRVRNLLLVSGDQQIAADGVVSLEGEQTLTVTLDDVRLDPWVDLVGYRDVGGRVSGTLALNGTADAPEVTAQLRVDDVTSGGEPVGALQAGLAYADGRMAVDATLTHVSGQDLRAEGFIPFAFRLDGEPVGVPDGAPVELTLSAEAFPISWAEPFLPPDMFRELDGTLTADVTVGGTQASPQLSGQVTLVDGRLAMETTGDVVFQDVQVVLSLARNVATITQARASDGRGGTLNASGTITLPELSVGELDIALAMNNFRVIETRTYRGLTLTATPAQRLRFSGTLTEPVLTGGVTLASGDVFFTDELVGPDLEAVTLSDAEIQRLEATFGVRIAEADTARSAFVDNLRLDLTVTIERNVWLRSRRNPRFDIEFAGRVDVQKPPGGENRLFGQIDVTRGRIQLPTLAGRAFSIGGVDDTYGRLIFNGPVDETIIDLRAGLEARSGLGAAATAATVYLGFQGSLADSPELTLSADPPMETADIACVVATGRPCGDAFQGGTVGDIALSQLGALVQGVAAEGLGLDVVEVNQRPTGEIVVTFGTYVTDRTFAAISQPVSEGQGSTTTQTTTMAPEVLVEYEALRWLLLRMERRNVGGVGGTLLFQFDY